MMLGWDAPRTPVLSPEAGFLSVWLVGCWSEFVSHFTPSGTLSRQTSAEPSSQLTFSQIQPANVARTLLEGIVHRVAFDAGCYCLVEAWEIPWGNF